MRGLRAVVLLALALIGIPSAVASQPLTILDVPFIAQSELLCGGAAAAMVMRYWGERGIEPESFAALVDRDAGGIKTTTLSTDIRARGWNAVETTGTAETISREIERGRPVIALIEDRRGVFHYVVIVAESAGGVVFHDPARMAFRVATATEFDTRWAAAGRWMLVVAPADAASRPPSESAAPVAAGAPSGIPAGNVTCDELVARGVRQAQADDLASAERTLIAATACPGSAPLRELAGLRLLQRRWPDAAELAAAATARDPSDAYAWKLLATARFVSGDRSGALESWNRAGEPRIDLIRLDGLTRTRYAVVQRLIGLKAGDLLTPRRIVRAGRRLGELPSGTGTLDFQPVPAGLVEVRGVVAERPLVPHGAFDLAVLSLATAIAREAMVSVSSPTGGGERVSVDWRFWARRPLYELSLAAPAPWAGVWSVTASRERQPFSAIFATTIRDSVQLDVADWVTGVARWHVGAGADRWNGSRALGMATAGVRLASAGDRLDARIEMHTWLGRGVSFQSGQLLLTARSSAQPTGVVIVAAGGVSAVTAAAPPDLWVAGDTGRARPLLLRAHPVLTEGERFRTERLGRSIGSGSAEIQRWWNAGPGRAGAAMFVDTARTTMRLAGSAITDIDVGIGFRGSYPGKAAAVRIDVARGLRDGETALSVVYSP